MNANTPIEALRQDFAQYKWPQDLICIPMRLQNQNCSEFTVENSGGTITKLYILDLFGWDEINKRLTTLLNYSSYIPTKEAKVTFAKRIVIQKKRRNIHECVAYQFHQQHSIDYNFTHFNSYFDIPKLLTCTNAEQSLTKSSYLTSATNILTLAQVIP